jgi:hypothetical protein
VSSSLSHPERLESLDLSQCHLFCKNGLRRVGYFHLCVHRRLPYPPEHLTLSGLDMHSQLGSASPDSFSGANFLRSENSASEPRVQENLVEEKGNPGGAHAEAHAEVHAEAHAEAHAEVDAEVDGGDGDGDGGDGDEQQQLPPLLRPTGFQRQALLDAFLDHDFIRRVCFPSNAAGEAAFQDWQRFNTERRVLYHRALTTGNIGLAEEIKEAFVAADPFRRYLADLLD